MAAVHYLSTVKITTEIRNVGDTAYAMRRAAAEACTQQLAAGVVAGIGLQRPVYSRTAALALVQPDECE